MGWDGGGGHRFSLFRNQTKISGRGRLAHDNICPHSPSKTVSAGNETRLRSTYRGDDEEKIVFPGGTEQHRAGWSGQWKERPDLRGEDERETQTDINNPVPISHASEDNLIIVLD